jgi:hypothetical protein
MKNQKKQFHRLSLLILFTFLSGSLAGCGGGGSSTTITAAGAVTGIGVIMESRLNEAGGGSNINSEWKRIVLPVKGVTAAVGGTVSTASVSDSFLSSHVAYIFLNWEPVSSASHYKVAYNGTTVWDSDDTNSADPSYDKTDPQAYLDLDDELSGKISSAGQYTFQVTALNGTTTVATYTAVTVSLGRLLENYPTGISYASGSLSWTGVTAASGYRVRIYDGSNILRADSGATLLTTLSHSLASAGLSSGTYYNVFIDAQALNSSETPVEITRGVSGFTY